MKVTKEKSAENRAALVETAARLFRERGIDGVGVAEISKASGLTHGALYGQFPSKQALVAEALTHGMAASQAHMTAPKPHGAPTLSDQLNLLPVARSPRQSGGRLRHGGVGKRNRPAGRRCQRALGRGFRADGRVASGGAGIDDAHG